MLEILGITMRNEDTFRVLVKANEDMNQAWLNIINEDEDTPLSFEDAINCSGYASNREGYLTMEIEMCPDREDYYVMYFFDDYETLDVELSNEDYQQCIEFINDWGYMLPDNDELFLGDSEWADEIPNDIPWKMNVA